MEDLITRALIFAADKHRGQTRNDGSPYIYHPIAVADMLRAAGYDETVQAAALLHDTLEDTDATEEEIAAFGDEVLEAVRLVTRPKGQDEREYIARIRENPVATAVKSADKIHNMWCCVAGTPGEKRTEQNLSFAARYIAKADRYYLGEFCPAVDYAIGAARYRNGSPVHTAWSAMLTDPKDLRPYTPQEREAIKALLEQRRSRGECG